MRALNDLQPAWFARRTSETGVDVLLQTDGGQSVALKDATGNVGLGRLDGIANLVLDGET